MRISSPAITVGVLLLLSDASAAAPPNKPATTPPSAPPASKRATSAKAKKKSQIPDRYSSTVIGGLTPTPRGKEHRSISVLSPRKLLRLAPRSTPELLSNIPGVVVQKTNHGGGSAFIRGHTGQQVLLMLDGIRLNNATTRYGPSQLLNTVDAYMLRGAELLRGPGSVLYGSDAIGGALNLMSREAPFRATHCYRYGGSLTARFATAESSQLYNLGAWTQLQRVAIFAGGSFKLFDNLQGGRGIGEQRGTGYPEGAFDAAVKVDLGRRWFLKLATNGLRQYNVPRTDKFAPDDFRIFTQQFRDMAYLKLTGSAGKGLKAFTLILSFQSHREQRKRVRLARDRIDHERDEVTTAGLTFHGRSDLGKWSKLVWGGDLYADWIDSGAHREAISDAAITAMGSAAGFRGRFVDGSQFLQGGLFVYDEIAPVKWLRMHLGGRLALSHIRVPVDPLATVYGFEAARIENSPVGGAFGATFTFVPVKKLHLVAGVHQGYRAPNLDDYSHVGSEGAAFDLPTRQLKPEWAYSFELGFRYNSKRLRAWAFGHYSLLKGFIARRYTGEIIDGERGAVRANAADGYLAGVEAFAELLITRGFGIRTWISYTRGDLTQPDLTQPSEPLVTSPMRRISPLQGLASLRYRYRKVFWAEVALRWSLRQDRLSPGDLNDDRICPGGPDSCSGTAGFAILNAAAGVRLDNWGAIVLRFENMTNAAYKFHGSGVWAPGFNAVAELRLRYR